MLFSLHPNDFAILRYKDLFGRLRITGYALEER